MNKQCTFCYQKAMYGVEASSDYCPSLYLCALDLASYLPFDTNATVWKLKETTLENELRELEAEKEETLKECAEHFGVDVSSVEFAQMRGLPY